MCELCGVMINGDFIECECVRVRLAKYILVQQKMGNTNMT